jgi:hypothetical protein
MDVVGLLLTTYHNYSRRVCDDPADFAEKGVCGGDL